MRNIATLCLTVPLLLRVAVGVAAPPPAADTAQPAIEPTGPASEQTAAQLLHAATAADSAGDAAHASALRADLMKRFPGTVAGERARLDEAEASLRRGDPGAAGVLLDDFVPRTPAHGPERQWLLGRVRLAERRYDAAVAALSAVQHSLPAGPARDALALSLFGAGRFEAAAAAFAHGVQQPLAEARPRFEALLRRELPAETFAALAPGKRPETDPATPWGAFVLLVRAEQLQAAGDPGAALRLLDAFAERAPAGDAASALQTLRRLLTAQQRATPGAVGALLPLSGRFRNVGEAALRPLRLALADGTPSGLALHVADTTGTPSGAAEGLLRLAAEQGVMAVLGPVGYKESTAAAELAERLGVVLLPLSGADGLDSERPHVFTVFATKAAEARALARTARQRLQLSRAALLFPRSPYGSEYAAAFWDEFVRLGGEVRAAQEYGPDEKDLTATVSALLGLSRPTERPPTPDFDALLVADQPLMAQRFLPLLKYYRVPLRTSARLAKGVQVLGTSAWNHPRVVDRAEGLTENSVFLAPWADSGADPRIQPATDALQQHLGRSPSAFEAQVFDGAVWLTRVLREARPRDRAALRGALAKQCAAGGLIAGPLACRPDGGVERALTVLTVEGERIRPLGAVPAAAAPRRGTP